MAGTPAQSRELRAQGRKTMRKLLDAGLRVFASRGYHAARVDDIVRAARTSHGTFYLYFANKEDLLRALALECAGELDALADGLTEADGENETEVIRVFLSGFFGVYRRYGPVIRAWMEDHVTDREVNRVGVETYTRLAQRLSARMGARGARTDLVTTTALMALLERSAYFLLQQQAAGRIDEGVVDAVTAVVMRGFFAPRVA